MILYQNWVSTERIMSRIKYPLQVTKLEFISDPLIKDLEGFARHINKHKLSCAIYEVDGKLVLMREIGKGETMQGWNNGLAVDVPTKDSVNHKLADKGVYEKRKFYREFKIDSLEIT